jgi:cytochrome P450
MSGGMDAATIAPARVNGVAALRWGLRLMREPLSAARRCYDALGPFVVLNAVPPLRRPPRAALFGLPLVLATGAPFHREILQDPATWRSVSLMPGGPRRSAARRMTEGLMRMTGSRHAHYRKLIATPLRRASVEALGDEMVGLAAEDVARWPVGESIDLWDYARRVLRCVTIGLLFGGDRQHGYAIAEMITRVTERKWARGSCAFPLNLPFTPYGRMVRECEALERRILAWAEAKRGHSDERDLAALVVNSPNVDGRPASSATIVGHIPSLYAGATEAAQSTLFWTLILLTQHPRVAREVVDELRDRLGSDPPAVETIADLPRLDAVVKESMRLIPPVPMQMRVAQDETVLAGQRIPRGTRVVLSTFLTTRMPDLYPEPDRFLPERWLTIDPTPFEFPVFGAGPRICPGFWFGLSAIKVALVAILSRYRIAVEPNIRIDYTIQPTMRPTGRVPVTLQPQGGAFPGAPIRGDIHNLVRL